jgi:hypothetical protein
MYDQDPTVSRAGAPVRENLILKKLASDPELSLFHTPQLAVRENLITIPLQ